jgi:hypothetical protein
VHTYSKGFKGTAQLNGWNRSFEVINVSGHGELTVIFNGNWERKLTPTQLDTMVNDAINIPTKSGTRGKPYAWKSGTHNNKLFHNAKAKKAAVKGIKLSPYKPMGITIKQLQDQLETANITMAQMNDNIEQWGKAYKVLQEKHENVRKALAVFVG